MSTEETPAWAAELNADTEYPASLAAQIVTPPQADPDGYAVYRFPSGRHAVFAREDRPEHTGAVFIARYPTRPAAYLAATRGDDESIRRELEAGSHTRAKDEPRPAPWRWTLRDGELFLEGPPDGWGDPVILALRDDWASWRPFPDTPTARLIERAPAMLNAIRVALSVADTGEGIKAAESLMRQAIAAIEKES